MVANTSETTTAPPTTERIRAKDPLYWEITEFLVDEAELLDQGRLMEWQALMAAEVRYQVPVRVTRRSGDPTSPFATSMFHLDETFATLAIKAQRMVATTSAWAEDPPSRTRRFVTNVRVFIDDEAYKVRSYVLLVRYRHDRPDPDFVSAERDDTIRRRGDGFEIVRRTVYLDPTTLGTPNLAVFL